MQRWYVCCCGINALSTLSVICEVYLFENYRSMLKTQKYKIKAAYGRVHHKFKFHSVLFKANTSRFANYQRRFLFIYDYFICLRYFSAMPYRQLLQKIYSFYKYVLMFSIGPAYIFNSLCLSRTLLFDLSLVAFCNTFLNSFVTSL